MIAVRSLIGSRLALIGVGGLVVGTIIADWRHARSALSGARSEVTRLAEAIEQEREDAAREVRAFEAAIGALQRSNEASAADMDALRAQLRGERDGNPDLDACLNMPVGPALDGLFDETDA